MRWFFLLLLLALAGLAFALYQSWIRLPANWAPWGDVELEEKPSWFARLQINSLAADPQACIAALDRSKLQYSPIAERPLKEGCGLPNGVRIQRSQVAYGSSVQAACALAAALYWYERRLDELARTHLGSGLQRIDHLGTYACRNINSLAEGRRSQHATANAIDIAGFQLADGTTVSVLRDWGKDTPKGRFLTAARDAACDFFNAVLGPDYNEAHANHFHFDLGRARICR